MDFDSRTRKLQREQEQRRQAARLRIKKEKLAKEAAARDRAKVEEQIRRRKLEQQRREEEERKRALANQVRTGGVTFKQSLKPVLADGEGDKVFLPPSVLDALTKQDAVAMGPMFFEITSSRPGLRTTHVGVLSFIAEEGTVGLPPKVVKSLGVDHAGVVSDAASSLAEKLGDVSVRYVRLAKATFARVVPETVGLSQVSELRAMLENNLRKHATLTVGDRLEVWQRGKAFGMKVVELQPEAQVTVIDTDVEIELDLPAEAQEQLEEQGARDAARTLRAHLEEENLSGGRAASHGSVSPTRAQGRAAGIEQAVGTGVDLSRSMEQDDLDSEEDDASEDELGTALDSEKYRLKKLQELPEEPPLDDNGVFTCQLRSAQIKTARRFRYTDPLHVLFDFAEANGGVPGHYRVVMSFPRRVLMRDTASAETTLRDAGLTAKQEAVILEKF